MRDPEAQALEDRLAGKSRVAARRARYVGAEDGLALVDMGDQRFPVPFKSGGFVPEINEPVWVDSIDGSLYMTGPVAPKPGMGVVATEAGDLVTVVTDFGSWLMPFSGERPTSGDYVAITWSSGPKCSKLSTSPEPPLPPPAPVPPAPVVQTVEFRAVDAGTVAKGGASHYWNARPWSSPSNFGLWFYGTQLKDTIPAAAEFVSLEMFVPWAVRRFSAPRWGLHNLAWKSGAPVVDGSAEFEGSGWVTFPWAQDWFHALKAGGAWAGVALNAQGTGHEEARSLAEDGMSGALRIRWR